MFAWDLQRNKSSFELLNVTHYDDYDDIQTAQYGKTGILHLCDISSCIHTLELAFLVFPVCQNNLASYMHVCIIQAFIRQTAFLRVSH